MAKNYAAIYANTGDSSALEQRWYVKQEVTNGQLNTPANADYFWALPGGSIAFAQPFESNTQRSGRHHTDIIKKKKTLSFSFSSYIHIDETLGSASAAEVNAAEKTLFKSLLGYEDLTSGAFYDARVSPSITFSLFEVGDKWARQARGCFIMGGKMNFPGNGEATVEWTGNGVESFLIGIGKSTVDNDTTNSITLQTGEGKRFRAGGLVMIIEANGTTRSADTAAGTSRVVTSVVGDVVTVSGAVLADADGSSTPIYLCYYEPAAPTAINNPVTGLVGSMAISGLPSQCFRSATVDIKNDHELVDYCYGHDALDAPFFVPANRLSVETSVELNLNSNLVGFFNDVQNFEAEDLDIVLGSSTGRRLHVAMPKIRFPVPEFSVPDSGSIPVTFTGMAYQSALDAADEILVEYV